MKTYEYVMLIFVTNSANVGDFTKLKVYFEVVVFFFSKWSVESFS